MCDANARRSNASPKSASLDAWNAHRWMGYYRSPEGARHAPLCLGMLVRNYRSHSRLLELPSRMFYQERLIAAADPVRGTGAISASAMHQNTTAAAVRG